MKTVFITGASSGIGRETAKLFAAKGWGVAATMRKPERETQLNRLSNVEVIQCDVTDQKSISQAVKRTLQCFGAIDVLVNNAGYYTVGPLEASSSEQIKRQLDTNLLGLIETTRAVLPHMRQKKAGIIINLSSIAGVLSIPLQSLYHATKYGVEGFSECLQYEVEPFGIQVKLIEPGTIHTNFCGSSMTVVDIASANEYQEYAQRVISNLIHNGNSGSDPEGVAGTIYRAATDGRKKMRYPTGKLWQMILLHKVLPLNLYQKIVKMIIG